MSSDNNEDFENLGEKLSPKDLKKLLAAGKALLDQVQQASPLPSSPQNSQDKQVGGKS